MKAKRNDVLKRTLSLLLCAVMIMMIPAFAETWTCENCGLEGLDRNFCPDCGTPKPITTWVCPACGKERDRNFCEEDGTARPTGETAASKPAAQIDEWKCPNCDALNNEAFCGTCGTAMNDDVYADLITNFSGENIYKPSNVMTMMNFNIFRVCGMVANGSEEEQEMLYELYCMDWLESSNGMVSYVGGDGMLHAEFKCGDESFIPDMNSPSTAWRVSVSMDADDDAVDSALTILVSALATTLSFDPDFTNEVIDDYIWGDNQGQCYYGNGFDLIAEIEGDRFNITVDPSNDH